MTTIYKYPFYIEDEPSITLPTGYQILHVGLDPQGTPCIWALVNTERSELPVRFFLVGTGHPVPSLSTVHIGSFLQGRFVWHLFSS